MRGLRLGLSFGKRGGGGIPQIAMTGLDTDSIGTYAEIGNHAAISVGFPSGVTAWTSQAWGLNTYGDTTYGTGANPTTFAAGDGGNLRWEGLGDDGNTYQATAPIRYAPGTAAAIADGQTFDNETAVNINAASSGANLTFAYTLSGQPSGVSINPTTGAITGTITEIVNGTTLVESTDQYGREYSDSFTYTSSIIAPTVTITPVQAAPSGTFTIDPDNGTITTATFTPDSTGIPADISGDLVDNLDGTFDYTAGSVEGDLDVTATVTVGATSTTGSAIGRVNAAPVVEEATLDEPSELLTVGLSEAPVDVAYVFQGTEETSAATVFSTAEAEGGDLSGIVFFAGTTDDIPLDLSGLTSGTYWLMVAARDEWGALSLVDSQQVTIDNTVPTLAASSPADNATGVAVDAALVLSTSEDVAAGTGSFSLRESGVEVEAVAIGSCTIDNTANTITIPHADFSAGAAVSVRWPSGIVEDLAGNPVAANTGDTLVNFTTAAAGADPTVSRIYSVANTAGGALSTGNFTPDGSKPLVILISICSDVSASDPITAITLNGVSILADLAVGPARAGRINTYAFVVEPADVTNASQNIAATFTNGNPRSYVVDVLEITNAAATGTLGNTATMTSDTPSPFAITTGTNGSLVIYMISQTGAATDMTMTGVDATLTYLTTGDSATTDNDHLTGYEIVATAGSASASFTTATSNNSGVAVEIKKA